jgi:hypothetical protein
MFHPSRSERAQTVLRAASTVTVLTMPDHTDVIGVHGTDDAGRPLLLVPGGGALARAAADDEITAVVHAIDVCPTPSADRVRAELWVGGWLAPVPEAEHKGALLAIAERRPDAQLLDGGSTRQVLRLEVAEVRLRDTICGSGDVEDIDPTAFTGAVPDPLIDGEADWLGHLVSGHPAEFSQLCLLIPEALRPDGAALRVIGLDRYGLTFRVQRGTHHRQVRVPFPTPVGNAGQLPRAMAELLHSAAARAGCCRRHA